MELDDILSVLDRTAANLAKLEKVWERAAPFVPQSAIIGCSHPEYDDLSRIWMDLLEGLLEIDGWRITEGLPDIEAIGATYVDYLEIDELPPWSLSEYSERPAKDIAEYRYRLSRSRRRAVRGRLRELVELVELALPHALRDVDRRSQERMDTAEFRQLTDALGEIDRLVGDTAERRGRWGDMNRHLHFGQGHDWHDIMEFDWPSVRADIEAAAFDQTEPIPVPQIDLGHAASGTLTGTATISLPWERLDDNGFERLLFDLLRSIPEHQNVEWLMQTRAPDRGRDLSLDRIQRDSTGTVRTERVIIQAKHWLARSIGPQEILDTLSRVRLWTPPARCLIFATSGRFTLDAVDSVERHNDACSAPYIEMWPENRLEALLAQKPAIAAAHGLR